MVEMKLSV